VGGRVDPTFLLGSALLPAATGPR